MKTVEDQLRERHEKARKELDAADKALDVHFRPLVEAAVHEGDLEKAKAIAARCGGDSITYVFLLDTIRLGRPVKAVKIPKVIVHRTKDGTTVDSPCQCFGGNRAHSTAECPWLKLRAEFPEGRRVQLHPATDRWMMGDRYGVVRKVDAECRVHVKLDVSKKTLKFKPTDILTKETNGS
jgi:hypothetical protein